MVYRLLMIMVLLFSLPCCTLSSADKGCGSVDGSEGADAGIFQPEAQTEQTLQQTARLIARPGQLVTKTLLPQVQQAISHEAKSWSRQGWKSIVKTTAVGNCLAAQMTGQATEGC